MTPRVAVLLVLVLLLMLVCNMQVSSRRILGRSSSSRRARHFTTPKPLTMKLTKTNTTRYPGNLCRVCTATIYPCNVTETKFCYRLVNTSNDTINGTKIVSEKNSTKVKDEGNYDTNRLKDDDDMKTGQTEEGKGRSRKKRHSYDTNWKERWFGKDTTKTNSRPKREWKLTTCVYNETKICTEKTCDMKCCDDTPINTADNSCTKKTDKEGELICLNGGTLSSRRRYCICPKGFAGVQCQHRKCSLVCQNGGVCQTHMNRTNDLSQTTYNDDYCVCPSDATGKFCENKKCNRVCQNNGTCKARSYWSQCLCQDGFYGTYCEKKEKEGDCPAPSIVGHCNFYGYRWQCSNDDDCPAEKKCCRNNCHSNICSNPYHANATCTYNNVTYQLDSVFTPDPCRFCTCNQSHVGAPHGVIECTRILCPKMPKYCTNRTTPEGECCPICVEDPDVALCSGNYTFPYFTNCPNNIMTFDVDENSNAAVVNLDLLAYDCKGDRLNVTLSEDVLLAGIGEDNFQLLSATSARDTKGNFAECAFHVRVRDPYPPVFLTCPTSFPQPHPGPVNWEAPVARDNVGLSIPPTSRYSPGQMMPPGDVMIEYWAEDYQGNIARCSFIVSVGDKMPPHHTHHSHHGTDDHGHSHHHADHSHSDLSIGVGVTLTLIIIVILGAVFFIFRRQRQKRNNVARGTPSTAVSMSSAGNGLGNGGMGWNNVSIPPQYSLPPDDIMSPPMYSRTDEMIAGLASGGEEAGELPSKNPVPK